MSRRFLDINSMTGQYSTFEYDHGTDEFIINEAQDFAPIVDANRREYNADKLRHGDGLGRKVASIPLNVYFDLRKRGVVQNRKKFANWLNDSDNRVFRTDHSRV